MDELIKTFHIDIKLMIAQAINFGIVFVVLWFGALKPLMKIMGDRTKKIEKSLKDANEIEKRMKNLEQEKMQILKEADVKAQELLAQAEITATKNAKINIEKAKEEVKAIIEKARHELARTKEGLLDDVKVDLSRIIQASMEKILETNYREEHDQKVIDKVLDEVYKKRKN